MNTIQRFQNKVKRRVYLMDGAMGTYYEQLYPGEREAELANLTHPERIRAIHRAYLEAGAEIIRTNTFAVNHMLFAEEEVEPALKCACEQARRAADEFTQKRLPDADAEREQRLDEDAADSGHRIIIAGSIGPIRQESDDDGMRVMTEYHRIATVLLEQGIRFFVLETFSEPSAPAEIAKFIKLQARVMGEPVWVQVQFTLNRVGYTQFGYGMRGLLSATEENPYVDGVGFNCGIGGTHMHRLLSELTLPRDLVLSVLPNAGYAFNLRGHQTFGEQPAYFCEMMEQILTCGANIVGGCCGTTPEHIAQLRQTIGSDRKPHAKRSAAEDSVEQSDQTDRAPVAAFQGRNPHIEPTRISQNADTQDALGNGSHNADTYSVPIREYQAADARVEPEHAAARIRSFIEKLQHGEKVYIAELDAPFDHRTEKFLAAGRTLQETGIDLVTVSDSPMARARADSIQMSGLLMRDAGVPVMPHICGRDRNIIGLRSAILGGYINGIRSLLLITGDPVGRDDRNLITSVFDVNSIRLMEYVRHMNEELFADDPVYYGGALNYAGANPEAIARRMKQKMAAGCGYFLTQPVYSAEDMERVRYLRELSGAKVLVGIMPLVSYKNALFMKNELPGIHVPDEIVKRYRPNMTREEAEQTAVEVGVEIGRKTADWADGYYFMTPFNRAGLISRIIGELREEHA